MGNKNIKSQRKSITLTTRNSERVTESTKFETPKQD